MMPQFYASAVSIIQNKKTRRKDRVLDKVKGLMTG